MWLCCVLHQGDVPPVPVSEEDEFLSMLKQQANILHQLQQQRGLAPVSTRQLSTALPRADALLRSRSLSHPMFLCEYFAAAASRCIHLLVHQMAA